MTQPYAPLDTLMALRFSVLQGAMLAPAEAAHVSTLLEMMDPPQNATVLDLGCGIGGVAQLMGAERPDLRFALVNSEPLQLALADPKLLRVLADYHYVPLPAGYASGAMFLYSLCYGRLPDALASAHRLVQPDGWLFVYDFERLTGNNTLMERRLGCHAMSGEETRAAAEAAGWRITSWQRLKPHPERFSMACANVPDGAAIFSQIALVAWRAVRQ
jgi:ubiquinone/menaquinone biosynthesis C-methylase UbiE